MASTSQNRFRRGVFCAPVFFGIYCLASSTGALGDSASSSADTRPRLLETVVVTGTRTPYSLADAPVEVQLIGPEDIKASGARDVAELLEREGGVYASRESGRGTSIQIQGLSSEHVLVLVNGRRMIGRINGAIDLSRFHIADIERVEIVKGPSSALYGGDALGGVVNIITRRGADGEPGGVVTLRGDSEGNGDAFARADLVADSVSASVSAGYSRLAGFDLDDSTFAEDGVSGESSFGSLSGRWQASEGFDLGFDASYSLDDTERRDGGTGGKQYATYKQIEEVRVGVQPRIHFDDSSLTLDMYYNRYADQFLQDQLGSTENTIDEETINELLFGGGQWDVSPGWLNTLPGQHTLSLGAEFQLERLDADRLGQSAERDRQSLYVQDDILLGNERLHLIPGVRFDRDSQFGQQVSPKLSLRYDISDSLFTRLGYGRGYRPPSFRELLLRFDNPAVGYRVEGELDLEPEKSTGFNAGLTWLAGEQHSVSISAFHNDVDDLIEIIQVESTPTILFSYRNVAHATVSGVDVQWTWQGQTWPLRLELGYGHLWSEDEATGDELSGRPEQRVNLAVSLDKPRYSLGLRGTWTGERVFAVELDSGGAPTSAGEAEAYALVDARASWKGFAPLLLSLGVDNMTDAGDPQYLPIQPRSYYLEVSWSL
ncbi:MAG: hypothetical protein CMN81_08830 [Spongiibacter sp.]|nr:hypothetical protein [Spongiibacter sp.]|tara:strand:+ start:16985 stop:18961 length:1977 start_codon:yes stop_codon:yes gene_type:complete